jgi:hypothetical protein
MSPRGVDCQITLVFRDDWKAQKKISAASTNTPGAATLFVPARPSRVTPIEALGFRSKLK